MQSQKEIAKALRVLTHEENYPVVVHCMHGKDRTGLLIVLIMLLCDIDPQVRQHLLTDANAKSSGPKTFPSAKPAWYSSVWQLLQHVTPVSSCVCVHEKAPNTA